MNKLKISTLEHHPYLYNEVLKLVESAFEYSAQYKVDIDFANLFDKKHWDKNFLLLDDNNSLMGHIGCRYKKLTHNEHSFRVALLGAIAIKEDRRGQGLFSNFLNNVLDKCSTKATFILLWSEKDQLYKKFAFSQVGLIAQDGQKEIDALNENEWIKTKLSEMDRDDFNQVQNLYNLNQAHGYAVKRSHEDWAALKNISSADFYLHKNEQKVVDMYFVANKGMDLNGIIHEFAFLPKKQKDFFNQLKKYKKWIPECYFHEDLHSFIYATMMRIGNFDYFANFVEEWSGGDIQLIHISHDEVEFNFSGEIFTLESCDFLQYIWGPEKIHEFAGFVKPLIITGLDSL